MAIMVKFYTTADRKLNEFPNSRSCLSDYESNIEKLKKKQMFIKIFGKNRPNFRVLVFPNNRGLLEQFVFLKKAHLVSEII